MAAILPAADSPSITSPVIAELPRDVYLFVRRRQIKQIVGFLHKAPKGGA
jgi:hypothetical protein